MEDSKAKISISFKDGTLEISGSEGFVTKQIENFKDFITEHFPESEAAPKGEPGRRRKEIEKEKEEVSEADYSNVLSIEGKDVDVITSVPGASNREKTVNLARIYLWGKGLAGGKKVACSEIRELCGKHACLDSPNFMTTLKEAKADLIIRGKARSPSQTAELTEPGRRGARELVRELNKR